MKKQFLIVLSVLTGLLAACSTANFAYYDDIYTSSSEKSAVKSVPATAQAATATPTAEPDSIIYETDENGNLLRTLTYYPGSTEPVITTYMEVADDATATAGGASSYAYDPDDYYDYSYSSRIRRFHTDVYAGWGYYDPYFTNMYWYDYCPASWGLSIYLGYNWWWPSYYYRPYYYSPYWYDYGFRYGWGWYGPYYAWDPYCPGYHPHGPMPIDWYHNNHDQNHSYYYGHRNNLGPSVGNGGRGDDRGERPDGNYGPSGGYGNGETNNYYSVNTSSTSFNQRYESLAGGTTGTGSSFSGSANGGNKVTVSGTRTMDNENKPTPVTAGDNNVRPSSNNTITPVGSNSTSKPANTTVTTPRTEVATPSSSSTTRQDVNTVTPASSNSTSVSRPTTTTTTTTTRPAATTTQAPKTVTRTVVTPSSVTTRPATTAPRTTTTTRPATTTPSSPRYYNNPAVPSNNRYSAPTNSTPSSSSRPSTSTPSSNSRSSYSSPSNSRPSSYSSPSTSRPSSTSSSSSSRSSYSSPSSSSSRSSYSGGSSHSSSSSSSRSSGGGGGSHGGGGRR